MRRSRILSSVDSLAAEFCRCCTEYSALNLAVAWCGNPNNTLPHKYLENFKGSIMATVGIAFNHTHPDAIEWFRQIGADIRIFHGDGDLFHPKVYLFRKKDQYALFVGSSNLTYGGFYTNCEVNSLVEGIISKDKAKDILLLEKTLAKWHSDAFSFKPTPQWLRRYRKDYNNSAGKQRKYGIRTPPRVEEEISTASWLRHADWDVYYKKVLGGLAQDDRGGRRYHDVLDAAAQELPVPWRTQYFRDIKKRRIIGGITPYGWLGHVAASGQFRSLLANGTPGQWSAIVTSINGIAPLNPPIPWVKLKSALNGLVGIGPTMKVWGRLLCIVRPDLYCTVASTSVRQNLSKTLGVPQSRFDHPDGYIQLIKLIHASPWFNSKRPNTKEEAAIWDRRAAFLDAIFY